MSSSSALPAQNGHCRSLGKSTVFDACTPYLQCAATLASNPRMRGDGPKIISLCLIEVFIVRHELLILRTHLFDQRVDRVYCQVARQSLGRGKSSQAGRLRVAFSGFSKRAFLPCLLIRPNHSRTRIRRSRWHLISRNSRRDGSPASLAISFTICQSATLCPRLAPR